MATAESREKAFEDQRKIWQALINDYQGVKENFLDRLNHIEVEIASWEEKKAFLIRRHVKADEQIALYQRKLSEAKRVKNEQESAAISGNRRKENTLSKIQRLERELAALKKEAHISEAREVQK